jgi:hypothetical protein
MTEFSDETKLALELARKSYAKEKEVLLEALIKLTRIYESEQDEIPTRPDWLRKALALRENQDDNTST